MGYSALVNTNRMKNPKRDIVKLKIKCIMFFTPSVWIRYSSHPQQKITHVFYINTCVENLLIEIKVKVEDFKRCSLVNVLLKKCFISLYL